jgi:KDO2-lipid IV(A) lauroyltransferase
VPLDLAYAISLPIADAFHAVWGSKRETARRNYAAITGRSPEDPVVRRLSRACFRQFGRYVVELLHVQGWGQDTVEERLEIEGEENFAQAEEDGKGAVFVSAHMGSAEVAASIAVVRGYRVISVAEPLRPKLLWDWVSTCRARMGVDLLPPGQSGIRILRALRRGGMAAFVIDAGVPPGYGCAVEFMGRQTLFPDGPARLARLSGAPLIFGLALRLPGGRFRGHVAPPVYSDRSLEAEEDIRRMTQAAVRTFEGFVRRHPEQWYVFRDIWPGGEAG